MGIRLPSGYTARALVSADAPLVHELVAACERHDDGEASIDLEDVVADWQRPSFDLVTQSVGVLVGDRLVAYAEVYRARRAEAHVHPEHRGRGIGAALLRWTWDVARARGGALVGQTIPESLSDAVALFLRHGYERQHTSWVLELPEGAAIPAVPMPAGVRIRKFEPGRDERAAYQVIEDAFNEWPGRDPSSFEDWAAGTLRRPGFEPWQLQLAEEGGRVIGACSVVVSGAVGWVQQIAVERAARGRGLGQALLGVAFTEARARGARRGELSTDSRTGALGLYQHVGMRVKRTYVHWAKPLPR